MTEKAPGSSWKPTCNASHRSAKYIQRCIQSDGQCETPCALIAPSLLPNALEEKGLKLLFQSLSFSLGFPTLVVLLLWYASGTMLKMNGHHCIIATPACSCIFTPRNLNSFLFLTPYVFFQLESKIDRGKDSVSCTIARIIAFLPEILRFAVPDVAEHGQTHLREHSLVATIN